MAFDGFAQQLEAARSAGTSYFSPDTSASLSVSLKIFNSRYPLKSEGEVSQVRLDRLNFPHLSYVTR